MKSKCWLKLGWLGLSFAFGAFIAGMVLSESDYNPPGHYHPEHCEAGTSFETGTPDYCQCPRGGANP